MTSLPIMTHTDPSTLTRKDFVSSSEVKWCPGCGDYAILAQVQRALPSFGVARENYVFVSGIGCAARFPYYMDTFGIHGIHGRAPAIATGVKLARPDLTVWLATGDGDALAIGGNHFMHVLRRNVGLKVLLFNNRIYGLTKGQYSPTSEMGKKTKSTPLGSVDYPIEPTSIAIGAGASFIARAIASDSASMQDALKRASEHEGTALVEILQNCVIFNDGAFDHVTEAAAKDERQLHLVHGKPLIFGKGGSKGIVLGATGRPSVVNVADVDASRLVVHDEQSEFLAFMLTRFEPPDFPTPIGVLHAKPRPTYEAMVHEQVVAAKAARKGSVRELLEGGDTWTVT